MPTNLDGYEAFARFAGLFRGSIFCPRITSHVRGLGFESPHLHQKTSGNSHAATAVFVGCSGPSSIVPQTPAQITLRPESGGAFSGAAASLQMVGPKSHKDSGPRLEP